MAKVVSRAGQLAHGGNKDGESMTSRSINVDHDERLARISRRAKQDSEQDKKILQELYEAVQEEKTAEWLHSWTPVLQLELEKEQ